MFKFRSIQFLILSSIVLVFNIYQVNAQQSRHFDDGFSVGASINYGGIHYEGSDGSYVNDFWSNALGYQVHVLYGYRFSSLFSLQSGIELFVHRYTYDDLNMPETTYEGESTGNFVRSKMKESSVGTTYLSLPINLKIRPISYKSFYAVIGPEISAKIAHSNGTLVTNLETDSGEVIVTLYEMYYDIPERSRNTLISANAGIGYSFISSLSPLSVELRAKHSITPFLDGDDFITSRIRSFSLSISYRL